MRWRTYGESLGCCGMICGKTQSGFLKRVMDRVLCPRYVYFPEKGASAFNECAKTNFKNPADLYDYVISKRMRLWKVY